MFRLVRYFSLASLVSIAVAAFLLGGLYREIAIGNLLQEGERNNVALSGALSNALQAQFEPLLRADAGAAQRKAQQEILHASVLRYTRGLSIVKVKIYDVRGDTVFSSDPEQIGEDKSANEGFRAALAGRPASELTHRDKFSAFELTIEDRDVLSSYIPVRSGNTDSVQAVFEIYDDVTPLLAQVSGTQMEIMGGLTLVLAGLYGILFLIVRHADRILHQQRTELISRENELQAAHDTLEKKVRDRTVELEMANAALKEEILERRRTDARNVAILEAIPDLLFELDSDGRYINYHSPRSELPVAPLTSLLGKTVADILPPDAAQVCMSALREAHADGSSTGKQYQLQRPSGASWFELSVSRKDTGPGQMPHFIMLSRNITERKDAEQRILRFAFFDSLTGLPNRQSFIERVDREIRFARQAGCKLGVLFMDLDRFKNINDTMGHTAGDLALKYVADRLRLGMRPADMVSRPIDGGTDVELARLGGDEFTALVLDMRRPEDALIVAHRILQLMRRPFMLNGQEVTLTTSIGIAVYPEDGEDAATLLKHADTAMYHAKDSGRDKCEFYSTSLTQRAVQRMELESGLRLALEREEFRLVYQPQICTTTGRIHAVEALIRWLHPTLGMVLPLEFIPVAERSGLIVPIGQWVLRTACAEAARWQRQGHGLRVAVNLSPLQFKDPNLVQIVLDALAQTGLAPELLELEVTEGAVMEDTVGTMATLTAFRECGVRIALDDFGTGYSSLSYLKRMPLSNLKVDQSFVTGLPDDVENLAIVRAILAMAGSLGLSVTAEGVETIEQAQTLKVMACGSLQGLFFSEPVPAAEIPLLLAQSWSPHSPMPETATAGRL